MLKATLDEKVDREEVFYHFDKYTTDSWKQKNKKIWESGNS